MSVKAWEPGKPSLKKKSGTYFMWKTKTKTKQNSRKSLLPRLAEGAANKYALQKCLENKPAPGKDW